MTKSKNNDSNDSQHEVAIQELPPTSGRALSFGGGIFFGAILKTEIQLLPSTITKEQVYHKKQSQLRDWFRGHEACYMMKSYVYCI